MDRIGTGTKFTLDRKIFSSDIWFASPWKLKIWVYLIGNANHTDGQFKGISIKRGQLIRSYRRIAKDCGYYVGYRYEKPSVSTVKRICEDFTKDARTTRRTTHAGTLFTICNYNELQPFPKSERHNERRGSGTTAEQNKNDKNEYITYTTEFEKFWEAYPKKLNKKKAFEAWQSHNGNRPELDDLITHVNKWKETAEWKKENGQFIPYPSTWLNGKRWEDEIPENTPNDDDPPYWS